MRWLCPKPSSHSTIAALCGRRAVSRALRTRARQATSRIAARSLLPERLVGLLLRIGVAQADILQQPRIHFRELAAGLPAADRLSHYLAKYPAARLWHGIP